MSKESDDDQNNDTQYLAILFEGADEVVPFSLKGYGTCWLSFTKGRNDEEVRRGSSRVNATSSRASSEVPMTMHPVNFSRTSRFRKSTFIRNIYRDTSGMTCNLLYKILNQYFFQCT